MPAPNSSTSISTTVPPLQCRAPECRNLPPFPSPAPGEPMMKPDVATAMPIEQLINALQSQGVRLADPSAGCNSRRGGAGPSDHKAMTIAGRTIMVPVHTAPAFESPFLIEAPDEAGHARLMRKGIVLGDIDMPRRPRFYDLATEDGIPF